MILQPAPLKIPITDSEQNIVSHPWAAFFSDLYRIMKSQISADASYQPLKPDTITYISKCWRFREEPVTFNLLLEYSPTGADPWTEKGRWF